MIKSKKLSVLLLFLLSLLMIGAVSAASDTSTDDIVNQDINSENNNNYKANMDSNYDNVKLVDKANTNTADTKSVDSVNEIKKQEINGNNKLSSNKNEGDLLTDTNTPGNFSDLQKNITNSPDDGTINLNKDYHYDTEVSNTGIIIENKKITINGNGHTLDAKGKSRIFTLKNATLTINNLKIINGKAEDDGTEDDSQLGGAISTDKDSTLNITNSQFNNNQAKGTGGAIENYGKLTIINTTFNQNQAGYGGGAISNAGTLTVINTTFNQNTAKETNGGAIHTEDNNAKVMNSLFNKNTAQRGDGIFNKDGTCVVEDSVFIDDTIDSNNALGGSTTTTGTKFIDDENSFTALNTWINTGNLHDSITLEYDYTYNSTYDGETYKKGIIINKTVTINGNGHIISGNDTARIFNITNQAKVTINNITLTKGKGQNDGPYYYNVGGAIYATDNCNITITDSKITHNTAEHYGGAIYTQDNSQINITNTNITQNNANNGDGGAIYTSNSQINITNTNITQNNATYGGAILADYNSQINITHTNITQNNANNGDGGAIYATENSQINISYASFIKNTAKGTYTDYGGGAIYAGYNSIMVVSSSLFMDNTASNNGGAIYGWDFKNLTINNNIFLNNTGNKEIYLYKDYNVDFEHNLDCNWFGNNETNMIKPDTVQLEDTTSSLSVLRFDTWLFLTADSAPVTVLSNSDITFKLSLYNSTKTDNKVSNFDNNLLYPVNLTVTYVNGTGANRVKLGSNVTFKADTVGTGSVTANISNVKYTQKIKTVLETSFSALYNNITKQDTIILDHDYTYDPSTDTAYTDGMEINKELTIIGNGFTISGNNSARIFKVTGMGNLILENLTLTKGQGQLGNIDDGNWINCGGAIYTYNAKVTLINTTLQNNNATNGGAISAWSNSQINITTSTLKNNQATGEYGYGGAITAVNSTITITTSTIQNNTAELGGAIFAYNNSQVNITTTTLQNNNATNGGAIYAINANVTIINSTLKNNNATRNGGAIYAINANVTIINSTLQNNNATTGGAIYAINANVTIINSTLKNNNATTGGAIFARTSTITINNSTLQNNNATRIGGAIYTEYKSELSVISSLIMNNNADVNGSAIYGWNFDDLTVNHNIFLNNSETNSVIYLRKTFSSNIEYNLDYNWFGNTADNSTDKPNIGFENIDDKEFDNWLFLNATAVPDLITVLSSSNITFELFLYNSSSKNVTIYDNSQLKPVNLTITYTNGIVDKKIAKLNETIGYNPENSGIGSVTASIGGVSYTKVIKAIKDTSYTALYNNINQSTDPVTIIILTQDYIYDPNTDTEFQDGILINKTVIIKGDGHSISGNNTASIFHITDNGNLTLENITLTNSNGFEGGAISINNGNLTIINSTLTNNTADEGGAIDAINANVTIINSTFTNNTATYDGGAILAGASNLTITNTTLSNNTAGENGGAIAIDAINAIQTNIIDSTFINNNATQYGGAIYTNNDLTVENSLFEDNNASCGSGVYINNALFTSKNNTFINNTVDGENYKIRPRDPQITIPNIDDIIEGNPVTITITADEEFNTELVLNVNGNNYTVKMLNGKGQITLSDLKPGTYTATIQFDGNENYTNTTVTSNTFKVNTKPAPSPSPAPAGKQNTKILAKNKVYKPAKYRTYTVTVKNKKGKPVKNTKVKLKIGKKTYIRKTNKKGVATFKIKNTKKSKKSKKTKKYSKITATVNKKNKKDKLTLKRGSKTNKATTNNNGVATFKIKNSKTKTRKYTITLKTTTNQIIKKQKVTLKVKGKTYKAKTNNKGKATFKITNLNKKGKYKTTIKYNGNNEYNKSSKKVKITIKE